MTPAHGFTPPRRHIPAETLFNIAYELRSPLQSQVDAMIDGLISPDAARLASCQEEILRLREDSILNENVV